MMIYTTLPKRPPKFSILELLFFSLTTISRVIESLLQNSIDGKMQQTINNILKNSMNGKNEERI